MKLRSQETPSFQSQSYSHLQTSYYKYCSCRLLVAVLLTTFVVISVVVGNGQTSSCMIDTRLKSNPNVINHNSAMIATKNSDHVLIPKLLNERPSLLFMTASYTMDQFQSLQKVLDSMRDICNAGWNVTVHLQVSSDFSYQHPRYEEIHRRTYCFTSSSHIPIIIEKFGKIGFGLNSRHRVYMRNHLSEYDYFSYAEEDMVLSPSLLLAFLQAEVELKQLFGTSWLKYTPGFLRQVGLFHLFKYVEFTCVNVFILNEDGRIVKSIRNV